MYQLNISKVVKDMIKIKFILYFDEINTIQIKSAEFFRMLKIQYLSYIQITQDLNIDVLY